VKEKPEVKYLPLKEQRVIGGTGLLLLFLSALINYSANFSNLAERLSLYFYGAGWRVFFRLPGMGEELSFSVWWLIIGLPLFTFFYGLRFPIFRRTIWLLRSNLPPGSPFFLFLLLFSLFPWEYSWVRPNKSSLIIYLISGTTGLIFFLIGFYPKLTFLDKPISKLFRWLMELNQKAFLLFTSLLLFTIANLASYFIFCHIPHISDSIAQLFQARIFATGRLYLPSPKFPDFFDYGHIINNGRWYSQYQFLHPFFLMFGVLLKIPWIINPLLGGFTIPFVYLLGREVYDEKTGRLSALFASFNPVIFMMSAEYMNHATSLLFTTIFLLFFFRAFKERKIHQGIIAGISLGLVANCRVYTAVLIGLPFFFSGIQRIRERKGNLLIFLVMIFSFLGVSSLNLLYNYLTNGNPFLFGYTVRWGPGHTIGFGKSGWGVKHTPLRGLINIGHDLNLLNKFLFETPLPSLFLILLPFISGTKDKRDWLLFFTFLSLWFGHFFYWFHGIAFGARFLYESLPILIILSIRGFQNLPFLLRRFFSIKISDFTVQRFTIRFFGLLFVLMLTIGLPPLFRLYWRYWGVDHNLLEMVRKEKIKNALIFCAELGDVFNANPLDLTGEVIYAKDYGILNSALTILYPNRKYYLGDKERIKPLAIPPFPQSALKGMLDSLFSQGSEEIIRQYRTIVLPFKDLPPENWKIKERLTDFREITMAVMTGQKTLDDYLPSLLFWIVGDPRPHLEVFRYLEKSPYFVAGHYKFKRLWESSDQQVLIAEVRKAED